MGTIIKAFGHFIPAHRVSNAELAKRFDVTEDWIKERTGIEERKYFLEGATSDMAVNAAFDCLGKTDISPEDLDCIIVDTMTPDCHCPSTASIVHKKLGTKKAFGFDIMAACSGFIYALEIAVALIESKKYKNVLVCGTDKMSSCIDPADRKTVLLLADGAGAALLQFSAEDNQITDIICKLDSVYNDDIIRVAQCGTAPQPADHLFSRKQFLRFNSKLIFKRAVLYMQDAIKEILMKNGLSFSDIDLVVPHQANKRLIEAVAKGLGLPLERFIINVEQVGNTSAGTIPIAISEALRTRRLKGKETLLLVAAGAGYTYGAGIFKLNCS